MGEKSPAFRHYYSREYDTLKRFASYWHQIDEILQLDPGSVLEVGLGNGFVSNYLRTRAVNVTTVDIDPTLTPDKVGSVTELPFDDASFDVVSCCQVLEHLSFEMFRQALKEIRRVSRTWAVISIPDKTKKYPVSLTLPRVGLIRFIIPWWRIPPKRDPAKSNGHLWELGLRGFSLKAIRKTITDAGFLIEKTYRLFEQPKHRFFVLSKQEAES